MTVSWGLIYMGDFIQKLGYYTYISTTSDSQTSTIINITVKCVDTIVTMIVNYNIPFLSNILTVILVIILRKWIMHRSTTSIYCHQCHHKYQNQLTVPISPLIPAKVVCMQEITTCCTYSVSTMLYREI